MNSFVLVESSVVYKEGAEDTHLFACLSCKMPIIKYGISTQLLICSNAAGKLYLMVFWKQQQVSSCFSVSFFQGDSCHMHILNPMPSANFHFPVLGPQLTFLAPCLEIVFNFPLPG